MSEAVRIEPDLKDGQLAFDLDDILSTVGKDGKSFQWRAFNLELVDATLTKDPPADDLEVRTLSQQSRTEVGIAITFQQLQELSQKISQTINGTYTAYSESGGPILSVVAVDSSFWIVWSTESRYLEHVKSNFSNVSDCDYPAPENL